MLVLARADVDALDHASGANLHTELQQFVGKIVFQPAAVELIADSGQQRAGPQFVGICEVCMTTRTEKQPQPELAQVFALQVVVQSECVRQVVRANFDCCFPDFVRGKRRRERVAFDDDHRLLRRLLPELQRQRQAGEAATDDGYVVHHRSSPSRRLK